MRLLFTLPLLILLLNVSCTKFIEDLIGPLPDGPHDPRVPYLYIDDLEDIELRVRFSKLDYYEDDYTSITIALYDTTGDARLIKDGYIKINNEKLDEKTIVWYQYNTKKIPISSNNTYTLEVMLSDGSIYSEVLPFPSQEISNYIAPRMMELSDKLTVTWDNSMPGADIRLAIEIKYSDGSRYNEAIDGLDSLNSYTFNDSFFVNEPYANNSLLTNIIKLDLIADWEKEDFSENFTRSSRMNVFYRIEKRPWIRK